MELVHIENLRLEYSEKRIFDSKTINDLKSLLDQAHNVYSLTIDANQMSMKTLCSLMPSHIKQLSVRLKTFGDMKMIVQRLDHLSTVEFKSAHRQQSLLFARIIEWLIQEQRTFVHEQNRDSLKISFQQRDLSVYRQPRPNKTSISCTLF